MCTGASWVKENFKVKMSPIGVATANLLGRVFGGIYHLNVATLKRVEWENPYYIEFILGGELATCDFNLLTTLVIFAHDAKIRVSIEGCGPRYMKMLFHQRKKRTGSISERCPTIEDHIKQIRAAERRR